MLGILLIDKPYGITSHDVVNEIRRRFGTKRVGHAGTLDPAATGLLVVAVGPATRFLQYLPLEPKQYRGEITFGRTTTTQDVEGEVTSEQPVPEDLHVALEATIPKFLGLVQQLPPMFSAVKKGGKPLYSYARKGENVEREPRTVHIAAIELLGWAGATADVRVICSGGTYLRTLAADIGEAVGCGAFLSKLNRERVGRFHLEDSIPLDAADLQHLIPLEDALPPVPIVRLTDEQLVAIRHGQAIRMREPLDATVVGLSAAEEGIVGMARLFGNVLQPECVIPSKSLHDST